jgi:hypothetical protein
MAKPFDWNQPLSVDIERAVLDYQAFAFAYVKDHPDSADWAMVLCDDRSFDDIVTCLKMHRDDGGQSAVSVTMSLAQWVDYLGYTRMRCGVIPYGSEGQTIRDIGTLADALDVHLSEVHRLLDAFDAA